MEDNMMKTVKEIVKRERQKRRRRVGIMIVLIALCAAANFSLEPKLITIIRKRNSYKSVEKKKNQSNYQKA